MQKSNKYGEVVFVLEKGNIGEAMIKSYQKLLNALHIVVDAFIVIFSYGAAFLIQFYIMDRPLAPYTPAYYFRALVYIVPLYLLLFACFRLYQPKRVMGRRLEASYILMSNTLGLLIIILIHYLRHNNDFSRYLLWYFGIINVFMMILARNLLRFVLHQMRRGGFNQKHILLVGYSQAAESFIDRVKVNPQWGYNVRGILDDEKEFGDEYKGVRVVGRTDDIEGFLELNRLDEIVITLRLAKYAMLPDIVNACEKSGVHTKFIPDYHNVIPTKPYTEDLLGLPMVHIRHVPLTRMLNQVIKRAMDIVGSLVAIVLFSPIMLVTAIAVKCGSKGPLIYKQERVGLHNRPFMMYKFRSMRVQAPSEEKTEWTTQGDPRVTKVGRIIRSTSIDELPQLFNVLKGDMSLVGPRPERLYFVERFKEEIPRYMVKHQVRPGMTGWAQVNGLRGDTSIEKRVEYDLYYIENWSVSFDIKILIMTVFTGFVNKNAY